MLVMAPVHFTFRCSRIKWHKSKQTKKKEDFGEQGPVGPIGEKGTEYWITRATRIGWTYISLLLENKMTLKEELSMLDGDMLFPSNCSILDSLLELVIMNLVVVVTHSACLEILLTLQLLVERMMVLWLTFMELSISYTLHLAGSMMYRVLCAEI